MAEASNSLLLAPLFDPGAGRRALELPAGATLAEAVDLALPGHTATDRAQLRVMLVSEAGSVLIEARYWRQVRPRPGVRVVIRLVPGGDGMRSVLLAVVTIAAIALAPHLAPLIGVTSDLGVSLVAMGLNLVGAALVNSLIPVETPDQENGKNRYTLSGWSNTLRPDKPVPYPLGQHRYAPPFAAMSYSEIAGDEQYIRALFCFGYGPLDISDLKIGDTPIEEFDEVELEIRDGRDGDYPVTLYPRQVLEDAEQAELVRPRPRNDAGEVIGEAGIETPVVRVTAASTESVSLIFWFPTGLIRYSREGDERTYGTQVRIRQRFLDTDPWEEVTTLNFVAKRSDPFFRQYTWQLPSRGRWQIEVTRMNRENTNSRYHDRVMLAAVQSIRPEYPINFDKPLALLSMRIRATYQLNGQLDAVNALVKRYALDWDGETWVEGLSRNPAVAYVAALTGPANPYPASSTEIDWEQVEAWHAFCATKGLKYDRIHESEESLGDMLRAICGAGRAAPRHDGLKWGVVIDRPQELVVDHLDPRNSYDFRWSRQYIDPPHALRVTFNDEANSYERGERLVPWPGHSGDITLTEELALPGKTDPDEVWIEARRRMYEIEHRPDIFTCMQDGAARVATRGDLVMVSHYVLDQTQLAARVARVDGPALVLDETVTVEEGVQYGVRYRVYADDNDIIGTSVVSQVSAPVGETSLLILPGATTLPLEGSVVQFGLLGSESLAARVLDVEPGENLSVQLRLAAAATIIDDLTDAEVPEDWDGIVGEAITFTPTAPLAPRFVFIDSLVYGSIFEEDGGDSTELRITLRLLPAQGETALVTAYRIEYRLEGVSSWTNVTVPQASGGVEISGYSDGDGVELRAIAIGECGLQSSATSTITHVVGIGAAELPVALDSDAISVEGGLGHAAITIGVTAGGTTELQLYRAPSGTLLDQTAHALGTPISVSAGTSAMIVDGDGTRVALVVNGSFEADSDWSKGSGWTIAAGVAQHASGIAGALAQDITVAAGEMVRIAFSVSGRSLGSVTPSLTGGTTVAGAGVSANGRHFLELGAVSGTDTFELDADADFDGSIDDVTLYVRTAACAPQGVWDYHFKPLNDDGAEAAISGPVTAEIA